MSDLEYRNSGNYLVRSKFKSVLQYSQSYMGLPLVAAGEIREGSTRRGDRVYAAVST